MPDTSSLPSVRQVPTILGAALQASTTIDWFASPG
jgi:hypothetical protein